MGIKNYEVKNCSVNQKQLLSPSGERWCLSTIQRWIKLFYKYLQVSGKHDSGYYFFSSLFLEILMTHTSSTPARPTGQTISFKKICAADITRPTVIFSFLLWALLPPCLFPSHSRCVQSGLHTCSRRCRLVLEQCPLPF